MENSSLQLTAAKATYLGCLLRSTASLNPGLDLA